MPETYLLLGIDAFWFSLPPKQLDLNRVEPRYYSWDTTTEAGLEYFRIAPGQILDAGLKPGAFVEMRRKFLGAD